MCVCFDAAMLFGLLSHQPAKYATHYVVCSLCVCLEYLRSWVRLAFMRRIICLCVALVYTRLVHVHGHTYIMLMDVHTHIRLSRALRNRIVSFIKYTMHLSLLLPFFYMPAF